MKLKKRQKLCFNCEGEIDLDVIVCPFCAADLREEKPEQQRSSPSAFSTSAIGRQTSQSLYPPPYAAKSEPEEIIEEALLPENKNEAKSSRFPPIVGPTVLFTLGIQLFLLGVFILLFSDKGAVILRWEGPSWFYYVSASIPFLYLGYRALSKLG